MYTTYIFDLDGTLLDTLGDLTTAVNYALRQFGMPEHTQADIRRFLGNGAKKLLECAVPGGAGNPEFEAVVGVFQKYYLQHSQDTTRPYDGVTDVLQELKRRGCRLAVVSNKFYAATQELVRHFFPYVEVAIGEHEAEGIRRKPAPDTVEEALRQLGADKKGAVYVGDSEVDLMTARNSGLPCISVLWGFRDRDFLLAHGATCLAEQPGQLLQEA